MTQFYLFMYVCVCIHMCICGCVYDFFYIFTEILGFIVLKLYMYFMCNQIFQCELSTVLQREKTWFLALLNQRNVSHSNLQLVPRLIFLGRLCPCQCQYLASAIKVPAASNAGNILSSKNSIHFLHLHKQELNSNQVCNIFL